MLYKINIIAAFCIIYYHWAGSLADVPRKKEFTGVLIYEYPKVTHKLELRFVCTQNVFFFFFFFFVFSYLQMQ